MRLPHDVPSADDERHADTRGKTFVIQISKGTAPKETVDKNDALAKDLKTIYGALNKLWKKKKENKEKIELTGKDYDTLSADSSLKASNRMLRNVVFGEEIYYSVEETKLPDVKKMDALRGKWDARMDELVKQYVKVHDSVSVACAKAMATVTDKKELISFFGQGAARYYEQEVLRTARPYCDWTSASNPQWFEADELKTWAAFADMAPGLSAGVLGKYQGALGSVFADYLANKDWCRDYSWMILTIWMTADPAKRPDGKALFEYAKRVWAQRLSQGRWLTSTMTFTEIGQLPRAVKDAGETAFYFLAVHALGDVMDPPRAAKPTVGYRPLIGFGSDAFDSAFYSGQGIKEALMTTHYGKCAFCESKVRAIAHGDVEHFRPKAGYEQGHAFNSAGYFWRAYEWGNLYYSCQVCNQVYKGNQFPVLIGKDGAEARKTYVQDDTEEKPVLIDPGAENPRDFIRFDPRTGNAYAYDWLRAYLEKRDGDKLNQEKASAETAIWKAPRLIPDLTGQAVNGPPGKRPLEKLDSVDLSAWSDMAATMPGWQLRGTRTIQILGLNRAELVSRRVAHLRALRGLFVAATAGSGPEKEAADSAIKESVKPNAEFSSLSSDAVETWKAEKAWCENNSGSQPYPWIDRYNAMLEKPPAYSYEEGWSSKDTPMMYFVADDGKGASNTERAVVYLGQKDELDASDTSKEPKGWYLEIPEEDFGLTLTIKRSGRKPERLTIAELLKLAQPWRKFSGATVTATGPFSMPVDFS
jgi:hypothetical protein